MIPSFRSVALYALFILPSATADYYRVSENGPNVLDDCPACPRLYTNFYRCQQIAQPGRTGSEVRDCVCDSSDNGWFAYIDACVACLPTTGTDDFIGNLGRMMYHVYHTCSPNGNITSDGHALCVSDSQTEDCMALRDSSQGETWVSFRWWDTDKYSSNRTQLLNLAAVKANLTTTSTTLGSTASQTATAAATGLDTAALTTASATGTGSQTPTNQTSSPTTGSQGATTTAKPNSAVRLGQRSQAGYVAGMLLVAGMVGGLV